MVFAGMNFDGRWVMRQIGRATRSPNSIGFAGVLALVFLFPVVSDATEPAPLPSWTDGPNRQAIIEFVAAVTDPGGDAYVAPADRIATFDNDGTLWAEKPTYFQIYFTMERIRQLAPGHPGWADTQPFQAVLEDDRDRIAAFSLDDLKALVIAAHAETTQSEFQAAAEAFLADARHPDHGVAFTKMTYQPMVELLDYLRANQFRVFIVSGGGVEFIRAFSEAAYGIPRENVIGSSLEYEFREQAGGSDVYRLPIIGSFDDRAVKPANIALHIGRRPVIAVGNSDGDLQMLQYTADRDGPSLSILLHHDDAEREYDYDHGTEAALAEAEARGWLIVSIARDFETVFSYQAP